MKELSKCMGFGQILCESRKIINFQTFTRVYEVYGSQHSFHPVANYDENASEFSKVLHIC